MHEPHLVEAQLRLVTLVLVCLPFWLVGGLAAVGGLVRLALGQPAAGVCVRELRVPLLAATAAAGMMLQSILRVTLEHLSAWPATPSMCHH